MTQKEFKKALRNFKRDFILGLGLIILGFILGIFNLIAIQITLTAIGVILSLSGLMIALAMGFAIEMAAKAAEAHKQKGLVVPKPIREQSSTDLIDKYRNRRAVK